MPSLCTNPWITRARSLTLSNLGEERDVELEDGCLTVVDQPAHSLRIGYLSLTPEGQSSHHRDAPATAVRGSRHYQKESKRC